MDKYKEWNEKVEKKLKKCTHKSDEYEDDWDKD